MTKHSPEPWANIAFSVFQTRDGFPVYNYPIVKRYDSEIDSEEALANAERIALCVNALAGISSEVLATIIGLYSDTPLQSYLKEVIENAENDITYIEDDFPELFLELAGGLDNLNVIRKPEDEHE